MKWTDGVCALVAAFCVSVPSAQAAAERAGTIEFSLGYNKSWTGSGATGESLGGGIGAGVAFWRAASPDLSWGLEASYDDLGKVDYSYVDPFSGLTGSTRFDVRIIRVNPAFRVAFGRPEGANFLAQVGAGLYNVNLRYRLEAGFIVDDDQSETKFAFNVGAGVGFPLGRTKRVNLMAAYHLVNGFDAFIEDFNHVQIRASLGIPL